MGYHIGTTAIEKAKKYLEILLKTPESIVVFKVKTNAVRNTAHRIRQAFHNSEIAQNEYKDLKKLWKIREQTDCIICVRKDPEEEPEVIPGIEVIQDSGIPFPSITRIEEVVGACLEHKGKVITFPNFSPNSGQLAVLQRWGEGNRIEFHYTNNLFTARPKVV